MPYVAFISYSHAADGKLASQLQAAIHRFARPWYRLRSVSVFRDQTSLAPSPALWESISKVLDEARYYILIASPESAQSYWVKRELEHWCRRGKAQNIIIVLSSGEIVWSKESGDFNWKKTTALPTTLTTVFSEEPLFLDLRWAQTELHLSRDHPMFRDTVASISAVLLGKSKDEITGDDVRRLQIAKLTAWSAVSVLTVLLGLAIVLGVMSNIQREAAVQAREKALARQLAAQSEFFRRESPRKLPLSTLLAVESMRHDNSFEGDQALRGSLKHIAPLIGSVQCDQYEQVSAIAFSLDDTLAAIGSADGTVRLVRIPELTEIHSLELKGYVQWAAFSSSGSLLMVSYGSDGSVVGPNISFFDTSTWKLVFQLKHDEPVYAVSQQGDHLFTLSGSQYDQKKKTVIIARIHSDDSIQIENKHVYEGSVFLGSGSLVFVNAPDQQQLLVQDILTGELRTRLDYQPDLNKLVSSEDNNYFASLIANDDPQKRFVLVWDLASGRRVASIQPSQRISGMRFDSRGQFLTLASYDGTIRVWELPSGKEIFIGNHASAVSSIDISKEGTWIASAGLSDYAARIWSTKRQQELATLPHPEPFSHVGLVKFSSTERWVMTAPYNGGGQTRLWGVVAGDEKSIAVHGRRGLQVRAIDLSPTEPLAASGSDDGAIWLFNIEDEAKRIGLEQTGAISALKFSPDGQHLAGAAYPDKVTIWRTDSGEQAGICSTTFGMPDKILFSADSRYLAASHNGSNRVEIWEIPKCKQVASLGHQKDRGNQPANIRSLAFCKNTEWLATASADRTVRLWSTTSWREIIRLTHNDGVADIACAQDGQSLASITDNGAIHVWDLRNVSERVAWKTRAPGQSVLLSPDAKFVVSTPVLGEIATVWDAASGKVVAELSHDDIVTGVDFDPSGQRLATQSDDGTVHIWDTFSWKRTVRMTHAGGPGYGLSFSADGRYIGSSAGDGTARVWTTSADDLIALACSRLNQNLNQSEWRQFVGELPYRPTCNSTTGTVAAD